MKNLYEFNCDCGRMGELEGRFLATEEESKAIIGKDVYFGEVLGKHSEISGKIEEHEISLLSDNQEFLNMAKNLDINLESGFNPLDYYTCDRCGCPLDVITGKCEDCDKK